MRGLDEKTGLTCEKLVVIQKQPAGLISFYIERRARDRPRAAEVGTLATSRVQARHPFHLEHTRTQLCVMVPSASALPPFYITRHANSFRHPSLPASHAERNPTPPPPPSAARASRSGLRHSTPPLEPPPSVVTASADRQARSPHAHHCRKCSRACSKRL